MPRVDTTPIRRTKRDAQQRLSVGVRSATSPVDSTSTNSAGGSISAPPMHRDPPLSVATSPKSAVPQPWRHPDELAYIRGGPGTAAWNDLAILRFVTAHSAFGVPPRPAKTLEQWTTIRRIDGSEVVLPRAYRLPLMWVAKFLWTSLRLVLGAHAAIRAREWDGAKFEILHVARLCATLLDAAAERGKGQGMERTWRCAPFDRALRRYHYDWLIMRDEFVRDFFREFGEEEYEGDVLKLGWGQWVLKGHKGFTLTKEEVANGITADEFVAGLVVDEDAGTFVWSESSTETRLPRTLTHSEPNPQSPPVELTCPTSTHQSSSPHPHQPEPYPIPLPTSAHHSSSPRPLQPEPHPPHPITLPHAADTMNASISQRVSPRARTPSETPRPDESGVRLNGGANALQRVPPAIGIGMGSKAPGCAPWRGHPADVLKALLNGNERIDIGGEESRGDSASDMPAEASEHELDANPNSTMAVDDEEGNNSTSCAEKDTQTQMQHDDCDAGEDDDLELDEDLELLYPETSPVKARSDQPAPPPLGLYASNFPPLPPIWAPASTSASAPPASAFSSATAPPASPFWPSPTPSPRSSVSRSPSPVPPALSRAQFSSDPPAMPAPSTPLQSTPIQSTPTSFVEPVSSYELTQPGDLVRLAQGWADEMRALRAEVGQLRTELRAARAPDSPLSASASADFNLQPTRRVSVGREEPQPQSQSPSQPRTASSGWAHPLRHLLVGREEEEEDAMDVDGSGYGADDVQGNPALPVAAPVKVSHTYAPRDGGPPRSRKFASGTLSLVA